MRRVPQQGFFFSSRFDMMCVWRQAMKQFGEGEETVKKKKKKADFTVSENSRRQSCGLKGTHGLINALGEGANLKLLHPET